MDVEAIQLIGAGIAMGYGAVGPSIGAGFIGGKALDAIGRFPELENTVFVRMFVAMAITESTGIYALVIALVVLFG